jgi:hypothetical protein
MQWINKLLKSISPIGIIKTILNNDYSQKENGMIKISFRFAFVTVFNAFI